MYTLQYFKEAKTSAVFQLESSGMKKYLAQLSPQISKMSLRCVLYIDPGPLESGMVSDFIDRKHGIQEVDYPHPQFQHELLQPPLESTLWGHRLSRASHADCTGLSRLYLRWCRYAKACHGQEKPEEMAKQRSTFVDGAIEQNIDGGLAAQIFDLVEKICRLRF